MPEETYEATANLTQATFLEFVQKYKDANSKVDEATGERKALRKIMKGVGIDLKVFDRITKDLDKAADILRERAETEARYWAWMGKPLGYQPEFGFQSEEDEKAVAQHDVTEAFEEGWRAGQETLAAQILPSDSNGRKRRQKDAESGLQ